MHITAHLETGTLYYKSVCIYKRRVAPGLQPVTAATPPTCERPSVEQNKLQKEASAFDSANARS